MRLYENAYPNEYEEIKTWYPVWYREVLEMDALWRVWGKRLDEVQAGIIQAVDNNFFDYADARAITDIEQWLGIAYDGPRTLVERRNVIKAFVMGSGHIGQKEIKELIANFTDGEVTVRLAGSSIKIAVKQGNDDEFNFYDLYFILNNRIPAHLSLSLVSRVDFLSQQYIGDTLTLVPRLAFTEPMPKEIGSVGTEYISTAAAFVPRFSFSDDESNGSTISAVELGRRAASLSLSAHMRFNEPIVNKMNAAENTYQADTLSIRPRINITAPSLSKINISEKSYQSDTITFKGGMNFGCQHDNHS